MSRRAAEESEQIGQQQRRRRRARLRHRIRSGRARRRARLRRRVAAGDRPDVRGSRHPQGGHDRGRPSARDERGRPTTAGTSWTFHLREGVKFHDGTDFNAEAVCFNFDRWYNFKGPFQHQSATYYWQTVFGGFSDGKKPSLYKSCEATDEHTVVINLTKPSASFLGALALTNFTIASPEALKKYDADKGSVDEETGFKPTGTYGTEHPTGTGPFKFDSWTRGDRLVMERNDDYWGDKAKIDELIFRPIADNAARLQALQNGEIQGYDLVEPQDIQTIEGDDSLQILDRPAFNVGYVTINQKVPPFDKIEVRQAVAAGLDREAVVDNFYAGRGEVATQFMPPSLFGYADDVQKYTYDPAKAKSLLQKAGVSMPLKVDFWYPTDVSRPYMPDPKRNFEAFAASLNKSGFKVVPHSAPWSPDYLGRVNDGNAGALNLDRLDRRLRRPRQLRRDVLPGAEHASWDSRTRRSSTPSTRPRSRPTRPSGPSSTRRRTGRS